MMSVLLPAIVKMPFISAKKPDLIDIVPHKMGFYETRDTSKMPCTD